MDFEKGQLVKSKAGRDKGEYFLIYDIVDDKNVLIVDGKIRRLEKPKLKKKIHLSKVNKKSNILDTVDKNDMQSQNKKIKREIDSLIQE